MYLLLDFLVDNIPFCECTTLCIHSWIHNVVHSNDGHLICFHFLAIMHCNDSIYICVQDFCEHLFSILLGKGIELSIDFFLTNVLLWYLIEREHLDRIIHMK